MGALQPGVVVLVRFPFSDLTASKLRPAVVLAHAGGVDWVLCQVTSNPYGDPSAVPITVTSFASGGLGRESVARPGKLFTASETLFVRTAGQLTSAFHRELVGRVVSVLQSGVR
jgi:PemK-like, MazF-like toxin of type II toxin-antitoxin system